MAGVVERYGAAEAAGVRVGVELFDYLTAAAGTGFGRDYIFESKDFEVSPDG